MTEEDIKKYWPHAGRSQRVAISAYHDCGWTIEEMNDDCEIPIHRPSTMETLEHKVIDRNGHVVSPQNRHSYGMK